jgi:UDP-N-acetylglucosamine acyltransferase
MTLSIHPTAIVSPKAALAAGVTVGPYTVIGDGVRAGRGTRIGAHAVLEGDTLIGEDNEICAGCVIGADSQIKAAHGAGGVRIGNGNVFREYATVHAAGTAGAATVIGNRNYIMSGVHVAHDCRLDNDIIIANGTQLSGHVEVGNNAFISGLAGVHQFVRIGEFAMVGGLTKLVTDVIPFALCDGNPAEVRGVNSVGMKRAKFTNDQIRAVKEAVQELYFSRTLRPDALKKLEAMAVHSAEVRRIIEFISASKRGIAPRARGAEA